MSNHDFLNWLVEAVDKVSLPHAETLRVKTLLDDLQVSLTRLAHQSEVPLTPGVLAMLKDMKHASTYIYGNLDVSSHFHAGNIVTPTGTVPSQMDTAFAGQSSLKVEQLYTMPDHPSHHRPVDVLHALKSKTSVDVIGKSEFDQPDTPPEPGEVEAFVAKREGEVDCGEVRFNSIEEVIELYGIEGDLDYKIGKRIYVEHYPCPVELDKVITLSPIQHEAETNIQFFGIDYDTGELIVVLVGEGNEVFRVGPDNLIKFVGDLNILDDETVIKRIGNIKSETRSKRRNIPDRYTFSLLPIGENYTIVDLNIDGVHSTFIASRAVLEEQLKA